MSGRPVLPCPPWCEETHDGRPGTSMHVVTRSVDSDVWVAMVMTDYGDRGLDSYNDRVDVQVHWRAQDTSVLRDLGQAEELAGLAEAFGRPDIAAALRELAGLAGGTR